MISTFIVQAGTEVFRCHSAVRGPLWFANSGHGRVDLADENATCCTSESEQITQLEAWGGMRVVPSTELSTLAVARLQVVGTRKNSDLTSNSAAQFGVTAEIFSTGMYHSSQLQASAHTYIADSVVPHSPTPVNWSSAGPNASSPTPPTSLQASQPYAPTAAVTFRIAASLTIAEYVVLRWLITLRSPDPSVAPALSSGNSTEVSESVLAGRVDIEFIQNPYLPTGLDARDIANDELVVVVGPSHHWAGRTITAVELAATPLITREAGSGTRLALERALETAGPLASPVLEISSTTAIKAAVGGGLAPAVLSSLAMDAGIAA